MIKAFIRSDRFLFFSPIDFRLLFFFHYFYKIIPFLFFEEFFSTEEIVECRRRRSFYRFSLSVLLLIKDEATMSTCIYF